MAFENTVLEETFCLDELVIHLQENRELKEIEGPGDSLSIQSSVERFRHLQSELMPQLTLLSSSPSKTDKTHCQLKVLVVH